MISEKIYFSTHTVWHQGAQQKATILGHRGIDSHGVKFEADQAYCGIFSLLCLGGVFYYMVTCLLKTD